jgi:hypothetical protein
MNSPWRARLSGGLNDNQFPGVSQLFKAAPIKHCPHTFNKGANKRLNLIGHTLNN